MRVIYDKLKNRLPIKVWSDNINEMDEICLTQATNVSNLPFLHKWVALMPDYHGGYGVPIGAVVPTRGVIIPNAVGVDIGCGMAFVGTKLDARILSDTVTGSGKLINLIVGDIMRSIPTGYSKHKKPRTHEAFYKDVEKDKITTLPHASPIANEVIDNLDFHSLSFGTLGGGNHFIELQEDSGGLLCIMIHSGSRSFGAAIAKAYNQKAIEINEKYFSSVPKEWGLSFLPQDDDYGVEYILMMQAAMEFAKKNRLEMMRVVMDIVQSRVSEFAGQEVEFGDILDVHHNYASLEHHYGEDVWVHRKGAILAREGMMGIVPGAMGSYSYIVMGLGNKEAFCSAPHGAGRRLSRTAAKEQFTVQDVLENSKDFVLGKTRKKDVAEEYKEAYKNISDVMSHAEELIYPIVELKTVAVVKG